MRRISSKLANLSAGPRPVTVLVTAVTLLAIAAGTRGSASARDAAGGAQAQWRCDADNAGLTLPRGFCATVFASNVMSPRHMAVAPNGDVFVARQLSPRDTVNPGYVALRDTDRDGRADVVEPFGPFAGGTGIALSGNHLYVDARTAILRFPLPAGALRPSGPPDTIVSGFPLGGHIARNFVLDGRGNLFVNIGSRSNSCQERDRQGDSKGVDPCVELETRAGIWKFSATETGQRFSAQARFATGLRNAVGLAWHPAENALYATQHGRDNLAGFGGAFTNEVSAEQPAEELMKVDANDDFGWPYCYFDTNADRLLLAPEYGGDGKAVGRCAQKEGPVVAFPGHWAPNALMFYRGSNFPARFRDGAFIAFHGSWNRAPLPQAGYNVVFVPYARGKFEKQYEVFATGFAGANVTPQGAAHRPTGLATMPDGSILIADDKGGLIYRVRYAP